MARSVLVLVVALSACKSPDQVDAGPPKLRPQVTIAAKESNVIGTEVTGTITVSGCTKVAQLQVLEHGTFLAEVPFTKSPAPFTLTRSNFAGLYSRGLAADLTLSAKVVCDDGRDNTSQGIGVTFFPVEQVLSPGSQVLPDAFIANGGLGGTKVTFIGCIGVAGGATALAAYDAAGTQVALNAALPFSCSEKLIIGPRSQANGLRWVLEPGVGALLVDDALSKKKQVLGNLKNMGVSTTGVGVFWLDALAGNGKLLAIKPQAETSADWAADVVGIANADPVIDEGNRRVWASLWQFTLHPPMNTGDVVVYSFDFDSGALVNGVGSSGPPIILHQTFSTQVNEPIMPLGTFNAGGSLLFMPVLSLDSSNIVHSTVLACSTAGDCDGASLSRKWTSELFDGEVNQVVPFSAGNALVAFGPYHAWFLSAQTGVVTNLAHVDVAPTGGLKVLGVQPGVKSELYLLNGPVIENKTTYPTEVVAVDRPETGEVYRFTFGSGLAPSTGITMGVDDTGQAWFRVGADLVKPLLIEEYRQARGPTKL